MLLDNKVALITGAARGIGKQIALAFAREGCNIAFTDLELNEQAQVTSDEIAALGVKVQFYASNAADFEAAHQVVEQVVAEFGRLDILVNNAGITRDTLLMRMTEQQWDQVIQVNLKSAFNFTHAVTPVMMRQAKELGSRGVRANAIAPGFIITDMTKALSEETLKQFVSMIPMRRGGEPEEVAKVALFLASDLSSYVSGQVIQVNGAMA